MNANHMIKKYFLLMAILAVLVACSSKPPIKKIPVTASPTDEISYLDSSLQKARMANVDILAPENFKEAEESLKEARQKFSKGKSNEAILRDVELGNAYLTRANAFADVARENTESVVAAREAAIKANAGRYFESEFKDVEKDYMKLTKDIEKNKLDKVSKKRPELQEKYLSLELRAIKEANLSNSRNTIELAKKEGAKKYAPRTLAIAEKRFQDTEEFINANRNNASGIARHVREANAAAYRALNINRMAKNTDKVSSEEVALMMDREQQKAASKESELQTIEDRLQTTQSALEREKMAEASKVEKTQKELEAQKASFEAHKKQEEKYEMARKSFSSDEAEVYKQGDDLLIRLKGMEFPSAQAAIPSKNYSLLSKVQKILGEFDNASVVVEGHTDSLGGKETNKTLSEKRAEAVKEYLQSNLSESNKKIEAIGFGDEKPLAGNKTAKGRAQNRRVDIVIKPESERHLR